MNDKDMLIGMLLEGDFMASIDDLREVVTL